MRMVKFVLFATALVLASAGIAETVGDKAAGTQSAVDFRQHLASLRASDKPDAERLEQFIAMSFEYQLQESPEFATYIGHDGDHHRWTDNSRAAHQRREGDDRQALDFLQSLDRDNLQGVAQLNYDLLLDQIDTQVQAQQFDGEYLVVNQMGGPQQDIAQMLTMMPARDEQNYRDIIGRLQGAPKVIDDSIAWMREGLKKGVTPPKITLREVSQQVQNQLVDSASDSPMLTAFQNFPAELDDQQRTELIQLATAAFSNEVAPAMERLHDFLADEYVPAARSSIAAKDLPNGEAWYAHRVKQMTTTTMSPKQIHELGLSEVERIRGEMEKIREQVNFAGDLQAFFEHLRTDPKFFYTDKEELLRDYRDISKRADPQLVKLFGKLPRTPYGIEPIPSYAEKSQTTAYYQPGSLAAGRPGVYYANTYALETRPKWEMEALSLHEAVPGHHLQIALQQELDELAWFRRFGGYTAFIEGWGLYSESLGEEMGFYQDPYSKFGQLTYEMWRAIRLVVDTGMHQLGWSRQQAIDFFKANSSKSEHDITVEIDRYIVWPGQALAYKIGELKLKELKARAKAKLGDRFDIRAFHDEVLGRGALPLTVLERNIDEWIAAQLKTG